MRIPEERLTVSDQMKEFDQWLTPQLERIKDSDKFSSEIDSICNCIRHLSSHISDPMNEGGWSIESIANAVIGSSEAFVGGDSFADDESRVASFYSAFFNLLFMATGATDNNLKNHFLIKLNQNEVSSFVPKRSISKKGIVFSLKELPEATKAEFVARVLASCFVGGLPKYRALISTEPVFSLDQYLSIYLREYIGLILQDEEDLLQLWAICRSYLELSRMSAKVDFGKYLLNSSTIYKIRGSVSASGGHITESILREKLTVIGLRSGIDFNESDVNFGEIEVVESGRRRKKTRAYDFILPYNVEGWEPKPKLFIQSQFYAGDSGSVSHKVVDQTASSRRLTLEDYPAARFIEYLDGAGYYASLRGDLEHMLTFDDTHSFIQVKSILVRLRRELQVIEFLTPVEFEHAIFTSSPATRQNVISKLLSEGYPEEEIERAENVSLGLGYISLDDSGYAINPDRLDIARRLFILDVAACCGRSVIESERKSGRFLLIPGFGANYGILGSDLSRLVLEKALSLVVDIVEYEKDIEWLLDQGVISRR
ncbi:hypothetical protein ACOAPY_07155 [Pseudomonas sp. P3C3]